MKDIKNLTWLAKEVMDGYTTKFSIERDPTYYMLKFVEEVGELNKEFLSIRGQTRSKNMEIAKNNFKFEAADTLALLLLLCDQHGVDLEQAMLDKWGANLPEGSKYKV